MSMVNAETLLVELINSPAGFEALDLKASTNVPADRPAAFVTVELTGGPVERHRSVPMLAVQVWGPSRTEASTLAGTVSGWLRDELPLDPRVGRATVSSVYNFPDPESTHARYQLTVELVTQTV